MAETLPSLGAATGGAVRSPRSYTVWLQATSRPFGGFAAWQIGRKQQSFRKMALGAALMRFPYLMPDGWMWTWGQTYPCPLLTRAV